MDRITRLNNMLQLKPDDAFLLHALALEKLKAGDDEEAMKIFMHLLELHPDHVGSYYHLVSLLMRLDRREEALDWSSKGLAACKTAGDQHAYRELNTLHEELLW